MAKVVTEECGGSVQVVILVIEEVVVMIGAGSSIGGDFVLEKIGSNRTNGDISHSSTNRRGKIKMKQESVRKIIRIIVIVCSIQ